MSHIEICPTCDHAWCSHIQSRKVRESAAAPATGAQAWKDYAQHLEWCRTCAEDSVGSCHEGCALKEAAIASTQAEPSEVERDAARYRWLRNDATQAQQDRWLVRLPEQADAYADAAMLASAPTPKDTPKDTTPK